MKPYTNATLRCYSTPLKLFKLSQEAQLPQKQLPSDSIVSSSIPDSLALPSGSGNETAAVQSVKQFRQEAERAEATADKLAQENKLLKKQLETVSI